ncbi:MAG: hypothetical protein H6562_15285 [Lewinellaceae bacterium]|nr:hypothetical protein [Lewinella sp.]MCB9280255.1 hypothetical protein [Lewinellaceae bacterium]
MKTRLIIAIPLLLFLLSGCGHREEYQIRLTSNERAMIDTLYAQRIDSLRKVWDSLCTSRHDSLVRVATDSIIRIRREEEARLRARIPVEQ